MRTRKALRGLPRKADSLTAEPTEDVVLDTQDDALEDTGTPDEALETPASPDASQEAPDGQDAAQEGDDGAPQRATDDEIEEALAVERFKAERKASLVADAAKAAEASEADGGDPNAQQAVPPMFTGNDMQDGQALMKANGFGERPDFEIDEGWYDRFASGGEEGIAALGELQAYNAYNARADLVVLAHSMAASMQESLAKTIEEHGAALEPRILNAGKFDRAREAYLADKANHDIAGLKDGWYESAIKTAKIHLGGDATHKQVLAEMGNILRRHKYQAGLVAENVRLGRDIAPGRKAPSDRPGAGGGLAKGKSRETDVDEAEYYWKHR